jgi:hypothetical protein
LAAISFDQKIAPAVKRVSVTNALREIAKTTNEITVTIVPVVNTANELCNTTDVFRCEVKRRAFFELAAEQRKYIQKILREVSKDGRLIIENPLVTANILVYLPKLIISRGWDMRREVDQETINEALFSFMQRGLGLRAKSPHRRKANGFAKSRPGWAARGERMSRRW